MREKRFTMRWSVEDDAYVRGAAEANGLSMSAYVRERLGLSNAYLVAGGKVTDLGCVVQPLGGKSSIVKRSEPEFVNSVVAVPVFDN